jgi:hypothetical protein
MRTNRTLLIIALAALAATLAGSPARADSFDVTLNTSTLSGTQTIAFGLTDGDGVANNTVALSAFSFGGGAALGSPTYSGSGISGNLNSGITMNDSGFSAVFSQQFTVGSSLSFNLTTTNNFAGGTPDSLAMYVCDSTFSNCYSDDTSTAAMLVLNLSGGTLSPSDFILTGASTQGLPAPVVTVSTVPEPSSLLLLTSGLFALGAFARKRMTANAA